MAITLSGRQYSTDFLLQLEADLSQLALDYALQSKDREGVNALTKASDTVHKIRKLNGD